MPADTVGENDIRGINIEKAVTGFALQSYVFKNKLVMVQQNKLVIVQVLNNQGLLDSSYYSNYFTYVSESDTLVDILLELLGEVESPTG